MFDQLAIVRLLPLSVSQRADDSFLKNFMHRFNVSPGCFLLLYLPVRGIIARGTTDPEIEVISVWNYFILASSVSVLSVVLSWYQLSQCHLELTDIKTLCLKYDTMAVTCNTKLLAKKLKPDF